MIFDLIPLQNNNIDHFTSFIYADDSPERERVFHKMLSILDIKGGLSFLLVHEGTPYGAFLAGVRGNAGYIFLIATARAHRGKGLGRLILNKGLEKLKKVGCKVVSLEVFPENEAALRLYEGAGFLVKDELFSLRDEHNSFFQKNCSLPPTIESAQPFTLQPIYRSLKDREKSWGKELRSLMKIIEKYNGELYLLKEYNRISGYIVVSRELNRVNIHDLYLAHPDADLLSYFLTSILNGEKVVTVKEIGLADPLLPLFKARGFYVERVQYYMQREI